MAVTNSLSNKSYSLTLDTTLLAGTNITSTLGNITATQGNIVATLGNVVITDGQLSANGATGSDGQVLISRTDTGKPAWASISAGTAVSLTAGANTLSMAVVNGGLAFSTATGDATAAVNTCYSIQHATPATKLTLTLPATAAVGSVIRILGYTSGGWRLAQGASQKVILGSSVTTTGAGGYVEFTNQYDCLQIRCVVADTKWQAEGAWGNLTVV